jgi:hypothetical protein
MEIDPRPDEEHFGNPPDDHPPAGTPVVPLAIALSVTAGAVHGTAVALAQAGNELFYLVDNAALDGPPLWVHEGEVETCRVIMGGT